MLKSLEELRTSCFYIYDGASDTFSPVGTIRLANEIQAEIDKFYLPRPLFENGEPVKFGDAVLIENGETMHPSNITFWENGVWSVSGFVGSQTVLSDERLKRPPEPDTQEKIDADVARIAHGYATNTTVEECMTLEIEALLTRQRKLDREE